MAIYISRFSNPELKTGNYMTVKISVGGPKFDMGYRLDGEVRDLMPFGLLGKFDDSPRLFKQYYFQRLNREGVQSIRRQLDALKTKANDRDVVLLCWEDVRKGEKDWCHRSMFAEWWLEQTGEKIEELIDPSPVPIPKTPKVPKTAVIKEDKPDPYADQVSLF